VVMGVNYNPKIVTDGLVYCIDAANKKCYNGSANVYDLTGNSDSTSYNGGFSSNNSGVLTFSSNQSINLGSSPPIASSLSGISSMTVCFWQYRTALVSNSGIVGIGSSSNRIPWIYNTSSVGVVVQMSVTSGSFINLNEGGYQPLNQWDFYCYNWDGSAGRLYRNLQEVDSTSFSGTTKSATSTNYIGYINGFNYLSASLGHLCIYNKYHDIKEIEKNYNATKGRYL